MHGQFVVPKSGGGYQTIDTQRGSVTAVSATSITVKSADGFSKTYQVVSSTNVDGKRNGISPVKTGHQVTVTATVSGSTATAASILDFNLLPDMHGGGGGPTRPRRPRRPPGWAERLAPARPGSGTGPGPDTTSAVAPPAGFVGVCLGPVGENLIRAGRHRRRAE